jgi:hypothetical protein
MNKTPKSKQNADGGSMMRLVRRVLSRFGYIVIPRAEIERLDDLRYMHFQAVGDRLISKNRKAFSLGMGDCAQKTADRLRKFDPTNRELSQPPSVDNP